MVQVGLGAGPGHEDLGAEGERGGERGAGVQGGGREDGAGGGGGHRLVIFSLFPFGTGVGGIQQSAPSTTTSWSCETIVSPMLAHKKKLVAEAQPFYFPDTTRSNVSRIDGFLAYASAANPAHTNLCDAALP